MCFWKSKQSKALRAKRDIVVYKIGGFANKNTFIPYFINSFAYKTDRQYHTRPNFQSCDITEGYHSYINIIVGIAGYHPFNVAVQKNDKQKSLIFIYSSFQNTLYLGKFIIPKGAIYCVNDLNEIVSNKIIYTGQYVSVRDISGVNLKEFFNSI